MPIDRTQTDSRITTLVDLPGQTLTHSEVQIASTSSTDKGLFSIQGVDGQKIVQSIYLKDMPTMPDVKYDVLFKEGMIIMHKDEYGSMEKTWALATGWNTKSYDNDPRLLTPDTDKLTVAGAERISLGMSWSHRERNSVDQKDLDMYVHAGTLNSYAIAQKWDNYANRINLHWFKAAVEALDDANIAKSNVTQLVDADITINDERLGGMKIISKIIKTFLKLKTTTGLYGRPSESGFKLFIAPQLRQLLAITNAKVGLAPKYYQDFGEDNLNIVGMKAIETVLLGRVWPKGDPTGDYNKILNTYTDTSDVTGATKVVDDPSDTDAELISTKQYIPTYDTALTGDLGADLSKYIAILMYTSPQRNAPIIGMSGRPYLWVAPISHTGNWVVGLRSMYTIYKWKNLAKRFLYGLKLPDGKTINDIGTTA